MLLDVGPGRLFGTIHAQAQTVPWKLFDQFSILNCVSCSLHMIADMLQGLVVLQT